MTQVTVFRDRFIRGWPERKPLREDDRGYVLELGHALERAYTSDAHFACYATPNGRRLNREALLVQTEVAMTTIAFDIDAPGHEATPEWRTEVRERVGRLSEAHPDPYYYETRGGCRIVYLLPSEAVISSTQSAIEWSRAYAVGIAYLARRFDLYADPACADWQRLYRLPRATRDGGQPENLPVSGDPDAIGELFIEPTDADIATARNVSRAFTTARYDFPAWRGSGDGTLYRLLAARGDVLGEHRHGWLVRCPNEAQHSTGRTGDGSTVLYPPAPGKTLGAICCLHAHCSGITPKGWLMFFTAAERQAADRSAA